MNGFIMTISDYLAICELAEKNGKKPGESMEKEMLEYIKDKQHIKKVEGEDEDLLKGNLHEEGYYKHLDFRGKL